MNYDELIGILRYKYFCEKSDTIDKRQPFYEENYKWTIGRQILKTLRDAHQISYYSPIECVTIFGIVVEIDYHNIECIKLFKEVGI